MQRDNGTDEIWWKKFEWKPKLKLANIFTASFFFIYVVSTANSKYVHFKILPMTGIEPPTSGIRSNLSTN